jgi:hypothetical protein
MEVRHLLAQRPRSPVFLLTWSSSGRVMHQHS